MRLVRYPGLHAAVERPFYRSDEHGTERRGSEISCNRKGLSATRPLAARDVRWPPDITGSIFSDSLIRSSRSPDTVPYRPPRPLPPHYVHTHFAIVLLTPPPPLPLA